MTARRRRVPGVVLSLVAGAAALVAIALAVTSVVNGPAPLRIECTAFALAISPDGRWLAASTRGLEVWSLEGPVAKPAFRAMNPAIGLLPIPHHSAVAFSPRADRIAYRTPYGNVHVYVPEIRHDDPNPFGPAPAATLPFGAFAFHPDGERLVTASDALRMWSGEGKPALEPVAWGRERIDAVACAPDGLAIAFARDDVQLWSLDRRCLWRRPVDREHTRALAFSPDGTLVAQASGDLRLFASKDGALVRTISAPASEAVTSVAFSPDGTLVATGHVTLGPPTVAARVWSVATGALVRSWNAAPLTTPRSHSHETSVVFTPDGTQLFVADAEEIRARPLTSR